MARLEAPLDDYLLAKSKAGGTGNYRRNAERVIREWIAWTQDERSTYTFGGLDVADCEAYALHLKQRANSGDLAASSARKYYDYVRAYCGWCADREHASENPAAKDRAEAALPDADQRSEHRQQLWTPDQRRAIMRHVDERAHAAVDEDGRDAVKPLRDRAFVATIAYSGVRGGEVVRDPNDARRDGVRWRDLDLEDGTMEILDKGDQEYRVASVPEQAVGPLRRYRDALRPASAEWPVFPTGHYPTLYGSFEDETGLRGGLLDAGLSRDEAAGRFDEVSGVPEVLALYREYELVPPAMSTDGARRLMRRLTQAADVPGIDTSDGEYLELHGGRRGAGDTLVREEGIETAQQLMRHNNPETTMEAYSHISASEVAGEAGDAFAAADSDAAPTGGTSSDDADASPGGDGKEAGDVAGASDDA